MPDNVFTIKDGLSRGLRAYQHAPRNTQGFLTLSNMKPVEGGFVPYTPLTLPVSQAKLNSANIATAFPFPQIFKGRNITLLVGKTTAGHSEGAGKNKIFEVDESDWTLTELGNYETIPTPETVTDGDMSADTSWVVGTNWVLGVGKLTHSSGSTASTIQNYVDQVGGAELVLTNLYYVSFEVTAYIGGSVSVLAGSGSSPTARSAVGHYTEILTCSGDTKVYITPSNDFNGTVDNVSIRKLVAKDIPNGGVWHLLETDDGWVLLNGAATVWNFGTLLTSSSPVITGPLVCVVDTLNIMSSGCWHRGRMVMGGFVPSSAGNKTTWENNWLQNFLTIIDEWPPAFKKTAPIAGNMVAWTTIGQSDIFWLMLGTAQVTGFVEGAHDSNNPLFLDQLNRNEGGWMAMPWQGDVLCTKPLGDNVVVYGEDGISALFLISGPVPTYGLKHLVDFGIADRGSVGGDDNKHIFVSELGDVWQITADLSMKRLGYKEFAVDLV
ncbi:hypothetical protein LCGC14_1503510, partial [marine sediment metagenome]